ncbi:MAG TPA: DUF4238 domain-containing protein [Bacteroidia bacterium]|nr:DUF4238 domain-containing protein [Bacteroidia bacterium]
MGDLKRQHYVPQFYLKAFSNNDNKKVIGAFIKKSGEFISNAPIKTQAYENFFYGKDGAIETSLSSIEGSASIILKNISDTRLLPKKGSQEYGDLWLFVLLQMSRTKLAVKEQHDTLHSFLTEIATKIDEKFVENSERLEIKFENPAEINLKILQDTAFVAWDLDCKLLINCTSTSFLTSDSPVCRYNQFSEKHNIPFGTYGLAVKGLQIFYPLNPGMTLMFYDSKVYKCKFKNRTSIELTEKHDIDQLNLLQILNSDEIIYSDNTVDALYLNKIRERSIKYGLPRKFVTDELKSNVIGKNKNGTIIYNTTLDYRIKLNLSILKFSDHAKGYKLNGYAVEVRNEKYRSIKI